MKATKDNATGLTKSHLKTLVAIYEARETGKNAAEIADALDLAMGTVYAYITEARILAANGKLPGFPATEISTPVLRPIDKSVLPVSTAINTDPTHPLWFPGFDGSMPPSLNQIMLYAAHIHSPVNCKAFYDKFTESAWCNLRGEKLTDWRVMFKHWHNGHPVVKEQKEEAERERIRQWKKYVTPVAPEPVQIEMPIEEPRLPEPEISLKTSEIRLNQPKVFFAPSGMLSFAEFHPAHKTTRINPAHYGTTQIPWKKVAEQAIDDYNVLLDYYLALLRQS